jgi:hypothetical protein
MVPRAELAQCGMFASEMESPRDGALAPPCASTQARSRGRAGERAPPGVCPHLTVLDAKMGSRVGPIQVALSSRASPARVALAAPSSPRSMAALALPSESVVTWGGGAAGRSTDKCVFVGENAHAVDCMFVCMCVCVCVWVCVCVGGGVRK